MEAGVGEDGRASPASTSGLVLLFELWLPERHLRRDRRSLCPREGRLVGRTGTVTRRPQSSGVTEPICFWHSDGPEAEHLLCWVRTGSLGQELMPRHAIGCLGQQPKPEPGVQGEIM